MSELYHHNVSGMLRAVGRAIETMESGGVISNSTVIDRHLRRQTEGGAEACDDALTPGERMMAAASLLGRVHRLPYPSGPIVLALLGHIDRKTAAVGLASVVGEAMGIEHERARRIVLGYVTPTGADGRGTFGRGRPPAGWREVFVWLDGRLDQAAFLLGYA